MKLNHIFVFLLFSVSIKVYSLPEVGLTAKAEGTIVTVLADKKSIFDILPYGLQLVPVPGLPENLHPVVIFIGRHTGLSSITPAGDKMTVVQGRYNEVTYGIPSVRAHGMAKTYTHLATLLLDSTRAIVGGRLYGFPKLPANFHFDESLMTVTKPFTGSKLISAEISEIAEYDRLEMNKNFAAVKASITPLIVNIMGSYKCIDFNWNFDSAEVSPVDVNLTVFSHMSRAVSGSFVSPGLDKSPLGAFRVRSNWEMSSPRTCE